ncbi:CD1871A family CXXC motif-containing protein [Desulfurobacterium sp.]
MKVKIDRKTGAALLLLIMFLSFVFIGLSRKEWLYVYKNGRLLCLSCIGIE